VPLSLADPQPIETAPRDGSRVEVFLARCRRRTQTPDRQLDLLDPNPPPSVLRDARVELATATDAVTATSG
jgi:hypothetical protein